MAPVPRPAPLTKASHTAPPPPPPHATIACYGPSSIIHHNNNDIIRRRRAPCPCPRAVLCIYKKIVNKKVLMVVDVSVSGYTCRASCVLCCFVSCEFFHHVHVCFMFCIALYYIYTSYLYTRPQHTFVIATLFCLSSRFRSSQAHNHRPLSSSSAGSACVSEAGAGEYRRREREQVGGWQWTRRDSHARDSHASLPPPPPPQQGKRPPPTLAGGPGFRRHASARQGTGANRPMGLSPARQSFLATPCARVHAEHARAPTASRSPPPPRVVLCSSCISAVRSHAGCQAGRTVTRDR
jgi:hypothetical protein